MCPLLLSALYAAALAAPALSRLVIVGSACLIACCAILQSEDDLFVMPSIPENTEDGSTRFERQQHNRTATREPLPLAMPDHNHIVGLPTGLELQDTMLM